MKILLGFPSTDPSELIPQLEPVDHPVHLPNREAKVTGGCGQISSKNFQRSEDHGPGFVGPAAQDQDPNWGYSPWST